MTGFLGGPWGLMLLLVKNIESWWKTFRKMQNEVSDRRAAMTSFVSRQYSLRHLSKRPLRCCGREHIDMGWPLPGTPTGLSSGSSSGWHVGRSLWRSPARTVDVSNKKQMSLLNKVLFFSFISPFVQILLNWGSEIEPTGKSSQFWSLTRWSKAAYL